MLHYILRGAKPYNPEDERYDDLEFDWTAIKYHRYNDAEEKFDAVYDALGGEYSLISYGNNYTGAFQLWNGDDYICEGCVFPIGDNHICRKTRRIITNWDYDIGAVCDCLDKIIKGYEEGTLNENLRIECYDNGFYFHNYGKEV